MSISVVCPACSAKLNAPDAAAGKRVKCPKCQGPVTVPEEYFIDPEPAEPTPAAGAADEPEDRPRRKSRTQDDEDVDRPRKKKKKKPAKSGIPVLYLVAAGIAGVAAVGGIVFAVTRTGPPPPTETADLKPDRPGVPPATKPKPPAGPEPLPTVPPVAVTDAWKLLTTRHFSIRVPPGAETTYTDFSSPFDEARDGPGIKDLQYATISDTGKGFRINILAKTFTPDASDAVRDQAALKTLTESQKAKTLFKVLDEKDINWGGRKGRADTFRGDGHGGTRRICRTETTAYFAEAYVAESMSKHWLGHLTACLDSFLPRTTDSRPPLQEFSSIESIVVTSDGARVVMGGSLWLDSGGPFRQEGRLRVWDRETETPLQAREFAHSDFPLRSFPLALSRDGKTVALVTANKDLVCFAVETRKLISTGKLPRSDRSPSQICFSPDGQSVFVRYEDQFVSVQVGDGAVTTKKFNEPVRDFARYLPDEGKMVDVRRSDDGGPTVFSRWNPLKNDPPTAVRLDGMTDTPPTFAVTPDGKTVAVCTDQKAARVRIHDTTTGKLIRELPADDAQNFRSYRALVFSPDGTYLAGIGAGQFVKVPFDSVDLFRVADGKRLFRAVNDGGDHLGGFAKSLQFSGDGKLLFYVENHKKVVCVETATGTRR